MRRLNFFILLLAMAGCGGESTPPTPEVQPPAIQQESRALDFNTQAAMTCHGGSRNGFPCLSFTECGSRCLGGPRNGLPCPSGQGDCNGQCIGGQFNGHNCTSSSQCPNGFCQPFQCEQFLCY